MIKKISTIIISTLVSLIIFGLLFVLVSCSAGSVEIVSDQSPTPQAEYNITQVSYSTRRFVDKEYGVICYEMWARGGAIDLECFRLENEK